MRHGLARLTLALFSFAVIVVAPTVVFAQGGGAAASLSGVVVDASGAVIPGASITLKNNATSAEFTATTADNGTFAIPALNAGNYTLTASLMGFKTVTVPDVRISAAVPASVRMTLEVGNLTETVTVQAGSDIVQTQSAAVATTININQVSNLPALSRSALDFVVGLPGVNTPGGSRDSTVNGLPQSTINITIDGMSIQDNFLKTTDGFFARVSPRIDSVEEVTVSTAAQGTDASGMGAVQIRFVSRSGTNELHGSSYFYMRHDALNANTWFNNRDLPPDPTTGKSPKPELRLWQPGTRVGGPIVIPGLFDGHNKAFFFVNYEENRAPSNPTRNRTILHPRAQQGIFRYTASGQTREVNLIELAAASGHVATFDPIIQRLLADIRNSTTQQGQIEDLADPLLQRYTYQFAAKSLTRLPTGRVDVNLTDRHRMYGSFNYNDLLSNPDTTNNREPNFPGFPGTGFQDSLRYTVQGTLRSTLTSNLVNEFRVGGTGGRTLFSPTISPAQFGGTAVADQGGFNLNLAGDALGITNAHSTANTSSREASTKVVENTLNWIRASHSLQFGGSFTQVNLWLKNQQQVPTINFGIHSTDPTEALFNTGNFPGASTAQLNDARELYAVLTGRILSINANTRLNANNEYVFLGEGLQLARMREFGFFVSDQWRWRPNFTVTAGLRYELQLPFIPLNDSYSTASIQDVCGVSGVSPDGGCILFTPGVRGQRPDFELFSKGARPFNIDWNNFAPNLGFAWTPGTRNGILGRILGSEGDSVFRGGYTLAYSRHGMSDFSDVFGANPGVAIATNRNHTEGNLGAPGTVFLRNPGQLGPPSFPTTRQYPLRDVITQDVNIFTQNLQVPYAQTWTAGWQRKLTRDTMVEVRYVGTRHLQDWITYNYNELNIVENGFLNEFRQAQANLGANIAAGRGQTFAFTGAPGTAPLPIFLAYFTGNPASVANDPTRYTGTNWTSGTFRDPLARFNPQPFTAANALDADQTRIDNALRAGLPANFLVTNPDLLGGANLNANGGYTKYNSLQLEGRKRLSHGLEVQGSYVFGKAYQSDRYSFRTPRKKNLDAGAEGGVTHAFKANWIYELPFGQGRRFVSGANGWLDRVIGGWSFAGLARIQSGRLLDFGNVRLVGMTKQEFEKLFKLQEATQVFTPGGRTLLYMLPPDIVENTVRAFDVSATSENGYGARGAPTGRYLAPANGPDCIEIGQTNTITGFGDCGVNSLIVTGPRQIRLDLSVIKRVRIARDVTFDFRGEFLNAFNHPWFTPVTGAASNTYSGPDGFRVTGVGENSNRIIQLVFRLNW